MIGNHIPLSGVSVLRPILSNCGNRCNHPCEPDLSGKSLFLHYFFPFGSVASHCFSIFT